ncbi:MAG TPA: MAPEG family protein [Burkholderiales bacterium]|nr:MAPEG family protein [Burkholderiales bacterium]
MNIEVRVLAWTVVLGLVQIVAASHAASLQRGYQWSASARDGEVAPLVGVAGRLDRALRNFSETFPLFAALVLAAQAVGRHSGLTESGAILYFMARLAYLPLYAFGVPLVRSLVWSIAAVGMLLLLVALLWE